ncbi:MAG: cytosine permease [Oscillospiraceae bacterium]|nr:cytosine permease [Oscillospiraceae bacterium]
MNETKNIFAGTEETPGDYAVRPVPEEKRIGWVLQGLIWSGTMFCIPVFSVGGTLAASMDTSSFLTAVFFGTVVIALVGLLTGAIGARTHLTSGFNARFALGATGGKIFSLILAVSLFGWFGYQCHDFAKSVVTSLAAFGFPGGSVVLWTSMGGLLVIATATAGFSGITLFSALGVPLLIALALAAAFVTAGQVDASVLRAASEAAGGMSLSTGITMVVGCYISGACITADVSRFSKTHKDAFWGPFLGHTIVFPLAFLLGGFFQYAYGESNICQVLFTYCGMALFVPFVLVVSIWAINNYNLYSAVLGIINTLNGHIQLPQWLVTLLVGVVSTLLGALGIMDALAPFLNLLGVLIPPVAAVIIADYYLYNRNSGLYSYENADKLKNFRSSTCLSAAAGIVVGLLCNYANIRFLNALCSGFPACVLAMLSSVAVLVIYNTVTHFRAISAT